MGERPPSVPGLWHSVRGRIVAIDEKSHDSERPGPAPSPARTPEVAQRGLPRGEALMAIGLLPVPMDAAEGTAVDVALRVGVGDERGWTGRGGEHKVLLATILK